MSFSSFCNVPKKASLSFFQGLVSCPWADATVQSSKFSFVIISRGSPKGVTSKVLKFGGVFDTVDSLRKLRDTSSASFEKLHLEFTAESYRVPLRTREVITTAAVSFIFIFFSPSFFHPIYYLRPSFLSLLVVPQIRGHIAGSSPPCTHYGSCLAFLSREDFSSSLVDSRRSVPTHATVGALSVFLVFQYKFEISPRTAGFELQDQHYNSSIRG